MVVVFPKQFPLSSILGQILEQFPFSLWLPLFQKLIHSALGHCELLLCWWSPVVSLVLISFSSSFATRLLLSLCGILILVCCFYSSLLVAALNIIALRSPFSDSPTALHQKLLPTVLPLSVLFSPGIQSNKELSLLLIILVDRFFFVFLLVDLLI